MENFAVLLADIAKMWSMYADKYLAGVLNTMLLAVVATFAGCIIGLACGILQTIPLAKNDNPVKKGVVYFVRAIVRVYVEVFRGTPMILQSVFVFYGLPYFFDVSINPNVAAYLVVSINTGAYMAETVRGGILSIDNGQTEGAKAIGMTHVQTMLNVILPQTLRNIIPQIGNNLIINIKDTSVMFIIGYTELFAVHKGVVGATYKYFPSAVIEMGIYLMLTVICSALLRLWEKKLDGPENFDVATTDTLAHTSGMTRYIKKKEHHRWEDAENE